MQNINIRMVWVELGRFKLEGIKKACHITVRKESQNKVDTC